MKKHFISLSVFLLTLLCSCNLSHEYCLVQFCNTDNSIIMMYAVEKGKTAKCPNPPTREGYEFINWFEDEELTKEFNFNKKISEETLIYAAWEIKTYYINFVTNIDEVLDEQVIIYNEKISEPKITPPSNCFELDGWYEDSNYKTLYYFESPVKSDLTLFAKWNINHTFQKSEIIKSPTCEENGEKQGLCSTCNTIITEELYSLGHSYGEWVIVTPVICIGIQDGLRKHICSKCNNEETEIIKSGPHVGKYKCSNCKEFFVPICALETKYTDYEGLTVIMNSITKTEQEAYISYSIDYTVKNTIPDSKILPGTFAIYYSNDERDSQTGFFNYLYYGEQETRSYTWKVLKTDTPVVFMYSHNFSTDAMPLYWAVPEK